MRGVGRAFVPVGPPLYNFRSVARRRDAHTMLDTGSGDPAHPLRRVRVRDGLVLAPSRRPEYRSAPGGGQQSFPFGLEEFVMATRGRPSNERVRSGLGGREGVGPQALGAQRSCGRAGGSGGWSGRRLPRPGPGQCLGGASTAKLRAMQATAAADRATHGRSADAWPSPGKLGHVPGTGRARQGARASGSGARTCGARLPHVRGNPSRESGRGSGSTSPDRRGAPTSCTIDAERPA
jgi:hypothetical protein